MKSHCTDSYCPGILPMIIGLVAIAVLIIFVFGTTAYCRSDFNITVERVVPGEGVAIVRLDHQPPQIIRVGDSPVWGYRIAEIDSCKIVILDQTRPAPEKIVIRLRDGGQTMERILSAPAGIGRGYQEVPIYSDR